MCIYIFGTTHQLILKARFTTSTTLPWVFVDNPLCPGLIAPQHETFLLCGVRPCLFCLYIRTENIRRSDSDTTFMSTQNHSCTKRGRVQLFSCCSPPPGDLRSAVSISDKNTTSSPCPTVMSHHETTPPVSMSLHYAHHHRCAATRSSTDPTKCLP